MVSDASEFRLFGRSSVLYCLLLVRSFSVQEICDVCPLVGSDALCVSAHLERGPVYISGPYSTDGNSFDRVCYWVRLMNRIFLLEQLVAGGGWLTIAAAPTGSPNSG
ncbi:hypothetical protein F4778DRAFT_735819 [Xylariomycetidae sp. FL2044]|nr:hypothetical protein F4778DRAFT_735819 [Xylariomycetidae sp. FL2044]